MHCHPPASTRHVRDIVSAITPAVSRSIPASAASGAPNGRRVSLSDRLWDLVAALLLATGASLFGTARLALMEIGGGAAASPVGESWVQRTDELVAQSQLGLLLAVVGVVVALSAATIHWRRGRRVTR